LDDADAFVSATRALPSLAPARAFSREPPERDAVDIPARTTARRITSGDFECANRLLLSTNARICGR
jgi:hypothetical protein